MINRLHALLHRPDAGWDPVAPEHADAYAAHEWSHQDAEVFDRLEGWIGGFAGKRVLDLGGGPGHCTVELARRGAEVTWHDVSLAYEQIARRRAAEAGVSVRFSRGYLEDSSKFVREPFDFVWNRICWNYCMDDRAFAELVYDLVKPGGAAYVDTENPALGVGTGWRRLASLLNSAAWIKVGHPYPPRGRVAALFQRFPLEQMIIDYSVPTNDRIFFRKGRSR